MKQTAFRKTRIILVEDNPDDAFLTIRAFKVLKLDDKIIHLKNGEEAIDFIIHHKPFRDEVFTEDVRLVLLDLKMPRVDGIEVLVRIRNNEATKDMPVVILTASDDDPDIKRCKELGANSYIVKPVTADEFLAVVSELGHYWSELNRF